VIVEQNRIAGLERVTARGHEAPVRNVAVSGSSR